MKIPLLPFAAVLLAALPALAQRPLSLEEALGIAEQRSPQIAAQRASAEAMATLVAPAGELPDPKLFIGVENLPSSGPYSWGTTQDSMTMRRAGVMQDFVRGEKREARSARAQAESYRETALLGTQLAELRREVATAWLDRHYAERSRSVLRSLIAEADLQSSVATAELAGGKSSATESIAARSLRATFADRMEDIERQARRATAILARWLGADAERPTGETPDIDRLGRAVRSLEADIERHPDHAAFAPLEWIAEADLRLARAATLPDWSVELSYGRRGGEFAAASPLHPVTGEPTRLNPHMVTLMFRIDLPLFSSRRQDPVTAARAKQLEQVRALGEDSKLRHTAAVRAALIDWETARSRLERHRRELVPLAEERTRAAIGAYAGARLDLSAVLDARRGALDARLAAVAAEAELARAWAQLAYLIPEGSPR
jgi:outer membrane protein TolC